MFCPQCKAEYREGYTHRSDCETDLVDSLESLGGLPDRQNLVSAWRGSDPAAFGAALAALRRAKIFHYTTASHDTLMYQAATSRPSHTLFVRRADLARSRKLLAPFQEGVTEDGA